MIRTIKVDLNAAFPNMPLAPFQVFKDSAAAITILNVPRMIASVNVSVKNVSNVSQVFTASRQGSSWMVVIPGSFLSQSGTSTRGVKIIGYDSMVPTPNEFTMGAADLFVMLSDGTVTPTQEGGDVRHIDFADLTADTVTLGELLRRLKGTAAAFLLALLPIVSQSAVFTAPLKDLPGSSQVVTNVTESAESDPVFTAWTSTNTYVKTESDPTVPSWAKAANPPAETDPTVPAWAKAANPPDETDPTVIQEAKNHLSFSNAVKSIIIERCPAIVSWYVFGSDTNEAPGSFVRWDDSRSQWVWENSEETTEYPFETGVTDENATFIDIGNAEQVKDYYSKRLSLYAVRALPSTMSAYGFADFTNTFTRSELIKFVEMSCNDFSTNAVKAAKKAGDASYVKLSPTSAQKNQIIESAGKYQSSTLSVRNNLATGKPRIELSPDAFRFYRGSDQAGIVYANDPHQLMFVWYATTFERTFSFPEKPDGDYIIATIDDIPSTNGFVNAETATNIAETVNAATRAIVQTWEGFLDGSNVVFSITNYISGAYNLNEGKFKILEMTNGVYREVYDSRTEIKLHIDNFKDTDFATATNQVITSVDAKIAEKADKAWGKYTSSGGEAPSNTVYMTAPQTVFAGGMEYERVAVGEGCICVLSTKGAPVYTQGDEGTFKFQDDGGTNYFGFAKTDSYVIGCNTDGITVQNHIVTLEYDVTMSGVPCIWYKANVSSAGEWEQLNTSDGQPIAGASHVVSWEQNPPAGKEFCYLNCPEAAGFFKATIEVQGDAKFMTNMPADLGGGILCTDGQHKVKINWNNGAPTLVPAN